MQNTNSFGGISFLETVDAMAVLILDGTALLEISKGPKQSAKEAEKELERI